MISESESVLEQETVDKIKAELIYLVRTFCKSYSIGHFRNRLFLHNSTPIEYDIIPIIHVEDFIEVVNHYWDYFPYIISNLSWDEETHYTELSDRITGTVNIERTIRARIDHNNKNVVCSTLTKNIFVPENILLASVILGINIVANKYYREGSERQIDHFKIEHEESLLRIIDYSQFLLKDRIVVRLLNYYLANHEGIVSVLYPLKQRINNGKLKNRYYSLLQFIKESKAANWKLNEQKNNLRNALSIYFNNIDQEKLYEMWVFFKILELVPPVNQIDSRIFTSYENTISVEYQKNTNIKWITNKFDRDNALLTSTNVRRVPDITLTKHGKDILIVEVKCMKYSDKDDEKQEPGPDRNIANQIIIYLDYVTSANTAIVLFADPKIRGKVILVKENRHISFTSCYPYHQTAVLAFDDIRQIINTS